MKIESIYLNGTYHQHHPSWDEEDGAWKARNVKRLFERNGLNPRTLIDVGCGAGGVLAELSNYDPGLSLVGYDVSPQLKDFWHSKPSHIEFFLADFATHNRRGYDALLMLDVFEHVRDPATFLETARGHAEYYVFHVPLDLSAQTIIRGAPLRSARKNLGHLSFYTMDTALMLLEDCGYDIIDWYYTDAHKLSRGKNVFSRLASLLRVILQTSESDLMVRIFGGQTIMVLCKQSHNSRGES
ncbi:AdoMet_MTases domain containing protein [Burkholderiales bacterium]